MMEGEDIIWLASYPKSGNTWLRLFIDAYHHDRSPDINSMYGTVTDQALRWYQACSPDNVAEMEPHIRALIHPAAMLNLRNTLTWNPKLVKTHNANIAVSGCRLIPAEITKRVVYIVRDPRDVVSSYAKHFGVDLDLACERMTDSRVMLFSESDSGVKAPHWATSWARHVVSYAEATDLDVMVVKYEDLKQDPVTHFSGVLNWIGVEPNEDRVARAVNAIALDKMREQEAEHGFKECSEKADKFFGEGLTGGWAEKLSVKQIAKIEAHAGEVMQAFGYQLVSAQAA